MTARRFLETSTAISGAAASRARVTRPRELAAVSPDSGHDVVRCHILAHEDQGAMGWLDTVNGIPPPTFPAGTSFSAKYNLTP